MGFPENTLKIKISYISIDEAIKHACAHAGVNLNLKFIDTEKDIDDEVKQMDGILLTPGFGSRGVEGMIHSAENRDRRKNSVLGDLLRLSIILCSIHAPSNGVRRCQFNGN